jgi:hypothetical protein
MRRSRVNSTGDFCEGGGDARAERESKQFAHSVSDLHSASPLMGPNHKRDCTRLPASSNFNSAAELFRLFLTFAAGAQLARVNPRDLISASSRLALSAGVCTSPSENRERLLRVDSRPSLTGRKRTLTDRNGDS